MGKPICKAFKRLGWGDALVCLQEVPKWVNGSVFGGYVVHSGRSRKDLEEHRDGFDCGFLVPASLNPLVRDAVHRPYWSGLLLPGLLVFSLHFIHKAPVGDNTDTHIQRIRQETQDFYNACANKFPNEKLSVVAGFDANVTLPPSYVETTGPLTLPPLPSHTTSMQHEVLSWLLQFGLRALNTFGVDESRQLLWTCGWKRPFKERSQTDYIAGSNGVTGMAYPAREWDIRDNEALHKGMDHRPLVGNLELRYQKLLRVPKHDSLKGWRPMDEHARAQFCSNAASNDVMNADLQNFEGKLLQAACNIAFTTGRQVADAQDRREKDAMQQYQNSAMSSFEPEVRKAALKQRLALRKKRVRERVSRRLQRLAAER